MTPPVYILIRTSNRPKYFKVLMGSIKAQVYPNIVTIVHSDDPNDKYVYGDIIVRSRRDPTKGRGHFNLYCNKLLQSIPPKAPGWYHFIDDDDRYLDRKSIAKFVKNSHEDYINVARADRGGGRIWPKFWRGQRSFQSECFLLHTKHRKLGKWWHKKGGDHHYTKQITKKLPINWIDNLIVCKAQYGKGRGLRLDLGTPLPPKKPKRKK